MPSPTLKDIYEAINNLRDEVRCTYATKEEVKAVRTELKTEITPIKAIVFTMIGTIALAVLYAVLNSVVKASP